MKKINILLIPLAGILFCSYVFPQHNYIKWSIFESGNDISGATHTKVVSSIGETFIGSSGNGNTGILFGFLTFSHAHIKGLLKEAVTGTVPDSWNLEQNYPNPFNPSTSIRYAIPNSEHVTLTIYDITGKEITKLVDQDVQAGTYEVLWNAQGAASGIYFYRIKTQTFEKINKMILLK